MRVLIACEFSWVVRRAFAARGHYAFSCDLIPAEDPTTQHYVADALDLVVSEYWDLIIAHPPCTYLANSGVRWLYKKNGDRDEDRWQKMKEGAKFFADLWNACGDTPRAFENPVMHWYAKEHILRHSAPIVVPFSEVNYIQPWEHGHPESKKTGLYLHRLPRLKPSNVVWTEMQTLTTAQKNRVHHEPPGPNRWRERSRTLPGIAAAMAEQWGTIA